MCVLFLVNLFTIGWCQLAGISQQVQAAWHSVRWYPLYNDVFYPVGCSRFLSYNLHHNCLDMTCSPSLIIEEGNAHIDPDIDRCVIIVEHSVDLSISTAV